MCFLFVVNVIFDHFVDISLFVGHYKTNKNKFIFQISPKPYTNVYKSGMMLGRSCLSVMTDIFTFSDMSSRAVLSAVLIDLNSYRRILEAAYDLYGARAAVWVCA